MAARLPQTIEGGWANAATTRGPAVDFDGLENALQGVGQEIERYDQARREADDALAGRELETARAAYEAQAIERATLYDGRAPGFASAELEAFDATIGPLLAREDLPDGVRDSLTRQSRDLRARVGATALATEARARGSRAAADRDAAEQAQAYRAIMAFNEMFGGMERARRDEWDGASPGLAEGLRGDFAHAREKVLEGLPAPVAERVRATLMSREVTLQATAMAQEDEARDAGVLRTVADGVRELGNRAMRDPSVLNRWEEEFAPIRAMLPAHLRAEAEREAREDVFARGLAARIDGGDWEAVREEIAAGRYDWMDPGVTARLGAAIESADAVRTIEDAQAEADLAAEIDADLRAILSGDAADPSLVARAQAIGGPDLAAKVRIDQQAARNVRPLMARLRALTPQQASAELERLTAASGDAVGSRTLELAREMVQQNQTLRAGDPAAWAATEVGPGDRPGREVRQRLEAFQSAPSAETAQAYARATWTAQTQAGVGQLQRRILPAATAEAWVAGLDADGAPASALPDLAQRIALFGPGFRGQIVRELGLAGLKPGDVGALTHYAERPGRMAQYVRGRAMRPNEAVPEAETRRNVDAQVREALAGFNRALASGDGAIANIEAARTLAYGLVAGGETVENAVRAATRPLTERWDIRDGFAIPTDRGLDLRRVANNAAWTTQGLLERGGEGLYAPPSERLTPEQSRRNYRDIVREHGRWRNTADGQGLELVTPRPDGAGWVRVRDAEGRDVVRSWEDLSRRRVRDRYGRWSWE